MDMVQLQLNFFCKYTNADSLLNKQNELELFA